MSPDTQTPEGFPRTARLLNARDFSAVFKKSRKYSDQYWTVLVCKNDDLPAKLGLAIAKKRAKRAVDRNTMKRISRECFRHRAAHLVGRQLVVMNRDAALHASKKTLRVALDRLLEKIT